MSAPGNGPDRTIDALAERIEKAETLLALAEIEREVRASVTGSDNDSQHARAWLFGRSSAKASEIARRTVDALLEGLS